MILAPFALVAQAAQPAAFLPPLDVPIRVVQERSETEDGHTYTYRIERLVRFTRDGDGYRAQARLVSVSSDAPPERKAMVEAGFSGLAGRTIEIRLDRAGAILEVLDLDAHWEAFCQGIVRQISERQGGTPEERAARIQKLAGPLRALPTAMRRNMLGAMAGSLVSDDDVEPHGTVRRLRMPAAAPWGGTAQLEGTRRFDMIGNTVQHSVTEAEGEATGQDGSTARITLKAERDSDVRTGFVTRSRQTVTTVSNGRTSERTSGFDVRIEGPSAWQ